MIDYVERNGYIDRNKIVASEVNILASRSDFQALRQNFDGNPETNQYSSADANLGMAPATATG